MASEQTISAVYTQKLCLNDTMSGDSNRSRDRQISRDEEMIREWAETHNVVPVEREAGQGESGRYEMVPERQAGDTGQSVDWDTFFSSLDEGDHVVVYHGDQDERPLEVTHQNDVIEMTEDEDIEERLLEGETVTSTITETTVVESVVTEEIGIESELVDTDIVDQTVVDVQMLGRETTGCRLVKDRDIDPRERFGTDRYLAQLDAMTGEEMTTMGDASAAEWTAMDDTEVGDYPYHVEAEVEETWAVTRELTERFTIESRITGSDVSEADRVEDHDIDTEGLHRSIVESGIIRHDRPVEDVLANCEIESTMSETDRVTTEFTRERVVEDEVLEMSRLFADITRGERAEMRRLNTVDVVDESETDRMTEEPTAGTAGTGDEAIEGDTIEGDEPVRISEGEKGKTVVDANGEEVGKVDAVDEDANRIYVDTHHGIGQKIMSALGWGDSEEDYPIDASQIERIHEDSIELKQEEHLEENR